jgi:hypothetical protein
LKNQKLNGRLLITGLIMESKLNNKPTLVEMKLTIVHGVLVGDGSQFTLAPKGGGRIPFQIWGGFCVTPTLGKARVNQQPPISNPLEASNDLVVDE